MNLRSSIGQTIRHIESLRAFAHMPLSDLFRRDRVLVFHHIPRSGGTSASAVLQRWFWIVRDYRPFHGDDSGFYRNKKDILALRNYQCLAGHFDVEGSYLAQRYPEAFSDARFRVFTFLRDPLEAKLSLYYYEKRHGINVGVSLQEHLLGRTNYIANRLPCTFADYQGVLGHYCFIGITEHMQESLDRLAELAGRPHVKAPVLNTAARDVQSAELSPSLLREFRGRNELDYLVYEYGLARFGMNCGQSRVGGEGAGSVAERPS